MGQFLLAAVASDGSVTFDVDAPSSSDFWIGPQRYGAASVFGTAEAIEVTDTRASGLRYTQDGVIRVYNVTSIPVPSDVTVIGGFAVTRDGQLCVTTDSVASATFIGGIAVRYDGVVFATGVSPLSPGAILQEDLFNILQEDGFSILMEE